MSVRIDPLVKARLERLAKKNERSLAGEVRRALLLHLATEKAA